MSIPLLEHLTTTCEKLGLPVRVALFTETPLPEAFVVLTPLVDTLALYGGNTPGAQVEEARLSVYVRGDYLPLRGQLTAALLAAGVTITVRSYIGFEDETGYHHYAIDTQTHHML
ncbi:hypothetical protein [Actinomyces faecalis]|uniref:hypothetical protein n=1 Tax=Actinomyces faecalis TaxID=2722820 RepID=UPI00155239D2|nr:hypothetical protein [Actinomyces faecalis]